MRDASERPEAVEMGTVKVVGTDTKAVIENVTTLVTDKKTCGAMANWVNAYGDSKPSDRILEACADLWDIQTKSI